MRLPSTDGDPEGDFYLEPENKEDRLRLVEAVNDFVGKPVLGYNACWIVDVKIIDKAAWSNYISAHVEYEENDKYYTLTIPRNKTKRE